MIRAMKGLIAIPFVANILLGTICPAQFAAAAMLPQEDGGVPVAMSSVHDAACPLAEGPQSHSLGAVSKSPCSDGHCLSMEEPEASAFFAAAFEETGSGMPSFPPAASSLLAFEIPHLLSKSTGPPLAFHIETIVLRV